jgi:hypothetical protein
VLSPVVDPAGVPRFSLPPLEAQADLVERYGIDTLLFCPNAWALRHTFLNQETGEMLRARCNRWDCLYCGPRKVDQWRQLVKAAEPTLFLTLSKSGKTVEEAARALTVFMRSLRRGSKGKGPHRIGARPAYSVEYFAVLERHRNFAENGFHWHLLLRGVDFIPYTEVIQPVWRSATHGDAEIGHIEAIRKPQVIGYVTKYLTKSLAWGEQGMRPVRRKQQVVLLDALEKETALGGYDEHGLPRAEQRPYLYQVRQDGRGQVVEEEHVMEDEKVSRARRIRYSRHFFPEPVAELRARLFADLEQEAMEQLDNGKLIENELEREEDEQPVRRSSWRLVELEEFTSDREEYKRRRRAALLDALADIRTGQRQLSPRVINIWAYQRSESRGTG